jgi:hypothetical protein
VAFICKELPDSAARKSGLSFPPTLVAQAQVSRVYNVEVRSRKCSSSKFHTDLHIQTECRSENHLLRGEASGTADEVKIVITLTRELGDVNG